MLFAKQTILKTVCLPNKRFLEIIVVFEFVGMKEDTYVTVCNISA
jgi:hypothetical protein